VHQRELLRRVKTLKRVELFRQMTDDELRKLAERLKYAPFAKGNMITKQGAAGQHWLFIIINGEAEVFLEAMSGEKRRLNVLAKGDFFGEMSLMTGAPRQLGYRRTDVNATASTRRLLRDPVSAPRRRRGVSHVLVGAPHATGQRCKIWTMGEA
jgi:CRP-like cAMP-binding protein